MPLDPSIALSVKPVQLANPLEQYMQVQQIQQAQNQSRLADLMYGEKQQQVARAQGLRDLAKGWNADTTDEQRRDSLRNNAYFDEADRLESSLQSRAKAKADAAKTEADAHAKQVETAGKQLDMAGQAFGYVRSNPTRENAHAALDYLATNGVYTPEQVTQLKRMVDANPANIQSLADQAFRAALSAKDQLPKTETRNLGGTTDTISTDPVTGAVKTVNSVRNTQSPDNAATNATTRRGQDMTDARAREQNALTREAQQTQVVVDPNQGPLLINKGTKTAVPATFADGTRVPSENAVSARKLNDQLKTGIAAARELIPKATASGAGALADKTAAFFGKSTEGADAAAQLDTIAGWMTANVPRMQGPQSDKDVLLYKQMAGDVANRNLPASRRLAALDTLEKLQGKYADANQNRAPAPAKPGGGAPNTNAKGWTLHTDANGNRAYVSPDGKSYEEVK
jgi:hypothetical protein